jgi:hypothetical protein
MPDETTVATTQSSDTTTVTPAVTEPQSTPSTTQSTDIDSIVNERVNAKLATHKRTLQAQLKEAQQKATAYDQLQGQVGELLESGLIDGVEDLGEFRQAAAETLDQYKSEAERLADEGKKQTKLLEDVTKRADDATSRYDKAMIRQGVIDEAVNKVVSPGALRLVQQHLAEYAENTDKGVVFNYPVKDEEGKLVSTPMTAKQAVEAMEANVTDFGTLFKSTVTGGAGGEIVDGITQTSSGIIDFGNLSMEKYMELQSKNPGALAESLAKARL